MVAVLGSCAVATLIAEVALRALYPIADPFAHQRQLRIGEYIPQRHTPDFRLTSVAEPGLPGVTGEATYETNSDGFVGPNLAGTATTSPRIFLVGGSTMECFVLGKRHNPASLIAQSPLVQQSRAVVLNTAHSGDASFDHVAMTSHRLAHLSPDIIVYFVGINDLIAGLRGERYDHPAPDQTIDLDAATLARLIFTKSHVGRLVMAALGRARLRTWDDAAPRITTHYRETAERCAKQPAATKAPSLDEQAFEINLRTLVATTIAAGAVPMLITQPHSWNQPADKGWFWMNCHNGKRFRPQDMANALAQYNDVTRRVAKQTGAVLVDLAAEDQGDAAYFYDDVHLNVAGAKWLSSRIATAIAKIL